MRELQCRVLGGVSRIATVYSGRCIVVMTHAEPIRAAVLHYRGMTLGDFARVRVDPASTTTILIDGGRGSLVGENETADAAMVAA